MCVLVWGVPRLDPKQQRKKRLVYITGISHRSSPGSFDRNCRSPSTSLKLNSPLSVEYDFTTRPSRTSSTRGSPGCISFFPNDAQRIWQPVVAKRITVGPVKTPSRTRNLRFPADPFVVGHNTRHSGMPLLLFRTSPASQRQMPHCSRI